MPPRVRETIGVVVIIVWRVNKVINSDNNNDIDDGVYKWRAGGVLGCLSLSVCLMDIWLWPESMVLWLCDLCVRESKLNHFDFKVSVCLFPFEEQSHMWWPLVHRYPGHSVEQRYSEGLLVCSSVPKISNGQSEYILEWFNFENYCIDELEMHII